MGARLQRLPRPEGGAEREMPAFVTHHGCAAQKLRKDVGIDFDPNADELMFYPGIVGWEMPSNTPFEVVSMNHCDACGNYVAMWFEWAGTSIFIPRLIVP